MFGDIQFDWALCQVGQRVAGDWYVDWITMAQEMSSFTKSFCSSELLNELKLEWNGCFVVGVSSVTLLVVDRGRSTGGLLKVKSNVNLGGAGGQGERGRKHYGRTVSCP